MEFSSLILISLALFGLLCGFYFLFRIDLCNNQIVIAEYPDITIIIPARNEELNIGKLLVSIQNQNFKIKEVLVINDGSTDKTKEIAGFYGANIIDSKPLPEDWKGKPWACWQGAQKAQGEILMFLDADTMIEPDGLKKIIDSYLIENQKPINEKGIVLSVAPYHKIENLFEEFSAIFNIIMTGSMNAFTPFRTGQPSGLFGQSLILSTKNYFEIEGHSSVKNHILENFFMARKFKERGIKLKCLGGKGTLTFRMYPEGFKSLINGWTKAFANGAGNTPFFTLLLIIFWISGGFIITIKLSISLYSGSSIILWTLLYFIYSIQLYWMLHRIGAFNFWITLLFPINLIFYVLIFSRSLIYNLFNKPVNWKSREVKV